VYTTALFSDAHDDSRVHKGSDEYCEESEDVSRAALRAGDMGTGSADMLRAAIGWGIMEYYSDVRNDVGNTRIIHKRSGRKRIVTPNSAWKKSKAVIQSFSVPNFPAKPRKFCQTSRKYERKGVGYK